MGCPGGADKWGMDVAGFASAQSANQLKTDVGYAVQRQALSAAKQEGAAMIALIEQAGKVGRAGGSDRLSALATGKGGQIDVYA
jgi:hypothetical protein